MDEEQVQKYFVFVDTILQTSEFASYYAGLRLKADFLIGVLCYEVRR